MLSQNICLISAIKKLGKNKENEKPKEKRERALRPERTFVPSDLKLHRALISTAITFLCFRDCVLVSKKIK